MTLDLAIRLTEVLLGFAFMLQSLEHFHAPRNERRLFMPRFVLSLALTLGYQTPVVCLALLGLGLLILVRYQGPYNGGSDRMSLLVLSCLCLTHFMPNERWQEYIFGYLAAQLVLSYFISGGVKIVNPHWRDGRALQDVFRFSAYPVSEALRSLAERPKLLLVMSWSVMLFEVFFPLALISQFTLIVALVIAAIFHLANACLFGLNRFFWIWLAAYPSILWLQWRVIG
jgi:hypothetical protein